MVADWYQILLHAPTRACFNIYSEQMQIDFKGRKALSYLQTLESFIGEGRHSQWFLGASGHAGVLPNTNPLERTNRTIHEVATGQQLPHSQVFVVEIPKLLKEAAYNRRGVIHSLDPEGVRSRHTHPTILKEALKYVNGSKINAVLYDKVDVVNEGGLESRAQIWYISSRPDGDPETPGMQQVEMYNAVLYGKDKQLFVNPDTGTINIFEYCRGIHQCIFNKLDPDHLTHGHRCTCEYWMRMQSCAHLWAIRHAVGDVNIESLLREAFPEDSDRGKCQGHTKAGKAISKQDHPASHEPKGRGGVERTTKLQSHTLRLEMRVKELQDQLIAATAGTVSSAP
uniref:SWIM-type domain-containing protein n=1 Tax=Pyramimonas obovata TaxID=1411642 RepID=A0A7S0WQS3_9CHLO